VKELLSAIWRGRCVRVDPAGHSVINALPHSGSRRSVSELKRGEAMVWN